MDILSLARTLRLLTKYCPQSEMGYSIVWVKVQGVTKSPQRFVRHSSFAQGHAQVEIGGFQAIQDRRIQFFRHN